MRPGLRGPRRALRWRRGRDEGQEGGPGREGLSLGSGSRKTQTYLGDSRYLCSGELLEFINGPVLGVKGKSRFPERGGEESGAWF